MSSRNPDRKQTWAECQKWFQRAVAFDPLFRVPLRVIDWAIANGLTDKTYAWRSHDNLVISTRWWRASRANRLRVLPKPDSVQLNFVRDGSHVRTVEVEPDRLNEELEPYILEFSEASKVS